MKIDALRAFNDNYIWAITEQNQLSVVDPGDAQPVLDFIRQTGLELRSILVTHHHGDHVGGIEALLAAHPVPVFGPHCENIRQISEAVNDGDEIDIFCGSTSKPITFRVISVPGHTRGHIAYYHAPALFCGDTLFGAGCGRLFEGTPAQMLESLDKLADLPDDTRVFCAHEYTQNNLRFAQTVEPDNNALALRVSRVAALRAEDTPTVPSLLIEERATNPFLRVRTHSVRDAVSRFSGEELTQDTEVFARLRAWRNDF